MQRVDEAVVDGFIVWTTSDDDPVLDAVAAAGCPRSCRRARAVPGCPWSASTTGPPPRRSAGWLRRRFRPVVLSFPVNRGRVQTLVTGPPDSAVTYAVTRHRWEGLLDAWRKAGGAPDDLRVAVCPANATALGESLADELFRAVIRPARSPR